MLAADPRIPKSGWWCTDVRDLAGGGEATKVLCEWCEKQRIRYVHTMRHRDWNDPVYVGCVCAGYLSGDDSGARERERLLRQRQGKRTRFLTRVWSQRGADTWRTELDDVTFVVTERSAGCWRGRIVDRRFPGSPRVIDGRRDFADLRALKLALFDYAFPGRLVFGDGAH